MNFLKDGLSVDETKVSMLMIAFIITLSFTLYMYYVNGFVGAELITLNSSLILAITGINVTSKIKEVFNSNSSVKG